MQIDPCRASLGKDICEFLNSSRKPEANEYQVDDAARLLEKPKDTKMGDFALPCFRFAKALGHPPPVVAEKLKEHLNTRKNPWVEAINVAGAFLNIKISLKKMAETILPEIQSSSFFGGGRFTENNNIKVMVEYSQPNTHKKIHVGHGRNMCLGDALYRLFKYNGYQVVPVNYIGDEGAHVAKCLWKLLESGEEAPATDKVAWLGTMYEGAVRDLAELEGEAKKQADKKISAILGELESKKGPAYDLWVETKDWCMQEFREIYSWLDCHFDHYFYESEVSEHAQEIVDEYKNQGVFSASDGAIGVDLEEFKLGYFIARKSDGNTLYSTKDLALAKRKFKEFRIDRSIYVVGDEQNHHFKQVFKVLELMGFPQAKDCFHLSYGMVNLPDGKMSSRKGNTVTFSKLQSEMKKELSSYLEKYRDEWSEEEVEATCQKLAVGAIRYGMLRMDPRQEIIFDLPLWLSFEGNTGPYLMYTYARTQSILRKATLNQELNDLKRHCQNLSHPLESELLRYLYDFNDVAQSACESYRPSVLASHLYYMCKSFNRFYAELSVLKAEPDVRLARLVLLDSFAKTLHKGLELLGITPPDRM